ncbi:hypothetical protein [Dactylosporangium sp. NPDC051484]|uniref:hypothetical protein n=1 Tax=Dactylosporangium sp. NPDC051484 TaxID=3154942 RepID=UPI00344E96B8
MPSSDHEILIELFRGRPTLAAELLNGPLHGAVPDFRVARLTSSEFTDVTPTEYRADAVVTLDGADGPVLAVVVEVQLRVDARKRRSWPVYITTLHARLGCPVALLVMCPDQAVADRCAAPIAIGPPGSVLTPVALGPDQVPVVTDLDTAKRAPELAVLSALAHGGRPDPTPVFEALLTALDVIDPVHANLYTDLVFKDLPEAARECLEELMTTTSHRYQSDFARRYFDEGEASGEARGLAAGEARGLAVGQARGLATSVLAILSDRGIDIPDDIRARIADCTDLDKLNAWLHRAIKADTIQDLDD